LQKYNESEPEAVNNLNTLVNNLNTLVNKVFIYNTLGIVKYFSQCKLKCTVGCRMLRIHSLLYLHYCHTKIQKNHLSHIYQALASSLEAACEDMVYTWKKKKKKVKNHTSNGDIF